MQNINEVERRVLEAWAETVPGVKAETHIDMIRERMRELAHHEAGHAAANAFLGENYTHFKEITIIPDLDRLGCFSQADIVSIPLEVMPADLRWAQGKLKIVEHLAGRVAESRVTSDPEPLEDLLSDSYWEVEGYDSREQWQVVTDEGRALLVAETIARRGWSPYRILSMVEKWTAEIVDTPEVWQVIEILAARLLEKGEITDFDEYDTIVEPILWGGLKSQYWRERFAGNIEVVEDQ